MDDIPSANSDAVVVITTVDQGTKAQEIARALVEARLAACVSTFNHVTSVYRWNDDIVEECESLLLIKTTAARLENLKDWFSTHHPYDVPEFLAFQATAATDGYLAWLLQATQPAGSRDL